MKNKKPVVFAETIGLDKNFNQSDSKSYRVSRQYFCSFCRRNLPDNSILFKGIGACPKCFKLSHKFVHSLRRNEREYARRFGGEK